MASSASSAATVSVRRQPGNAAFLGSMLVAAAGVMFMAALCGSYVSVRNFVGFRDFVPAALKFDNYSGFMTMVSALGASLSAEWALMSAKVNKRRWISAGYGFAAVLGLGASNAVWFIGSRSELVSSETPYAILFYAVLAATIGFLLLGVIASIVGLIRGLGGHIAGDNLLFGRASNVLVHLGTAAALAMFFLLFTYK